MSLIICSKFIYFYFKKMLLSALILIPFFGIFFILSYNSYDLNENSKILKTFALAVTVVDLVISLIV